MKHLMVPLILVLAATTLSAQEGLESYTRTITKFGGALTLGEPWDDENRGFGLTTMTHQFFDPFIPWGGYYGFGGVDIVRLVGGVIIGDTRLVTLGWRQESAGLIGVDGCLSPVLGNRTVGDTVFGRFYLGVKPKVGLYIPINEGFDVELAYEPVIHLYTLFGNEVKNKTYHDLSLYVVWKNFKRQRALDWKSEPSR